MTVQEFPQASGSAQGVPHTPHTSARTPVAEASAVAAKDRPAVRRWPLLFIGAQAAVAVWSGWVGLGGMCGFGVIHPLPGIADKFQINSAITLPVGIEAYGMYALGAWLNPAVPASARKFAQKSGIGSLALGMCGQVIYHLLAAAHRAQAPWPVVVLVSCLPVIALGLGTALAHLIHASHDAPQPAAAVQAPAPGPVREDTAALPVREPLPQPVRAAADGPGTEPEPRTAPGAVREPDVVPAAEPVRQTGAEVREELAAIVAGRLPRLRMLPAGDSEADRDGRRQVLFASRDALVAEWAGQFRDAVAAGERWVPDYDALIESTGVSKSWLEKAAKAARDRVLGGDASQGDAGRTGEDRTAPAPSGRTEAPYGDHGRTASGDRTADAGRTAREPYGDDPGAGDGAVRLELAGVTA